MIMVKREAEMANQYGTFELAATTKLNGIDTAANTNSNIPARMRKNRFNAMCVSPSSVKSQYRGSTIIRTESYSKEKFLALSC